MNTVKINDSNADVKYLQELLNKIGYSLSIDGSFGPTTDKHVKDFQSKHGLKVDGVVGNITWNKLKEIAKSDKPLSELEKAVLKEANKWLHVREVGANKGFTDTDFTKNIRQYGYWQVGYSWCSCFTTMIWRRAFKEINDSRYGLISKLLNPSVLTTYNNFKNNKSFKIVLSNNPRPASLMIMRSKSDRTKGHIGIVTSYLNPDGTFDTIEGNTGARGLREGDKNEGVSKKKRRFGSNGNLEVYAFITLED